MGGETEVKYAVGGVAAITLLVAVVLIATNKDPSVAEAERANAVIAEQLKLIGRAIDAENACLQRSDELYRAGRMEEFKKLRCKPAS